MTVLFAFLLFVGVGAIAVINAMWGMGYNWPEASEEVLVVSTGRAPVWLSGGPQ